MDREKNYEDMLNVISKYQQDLHLKNQKKIRVGLKVNIFLPLVFLILSFITDGSKLVFLILWIASLFGIAFYLLYVEFTDYKLVEKMKEIGLMEEAVDTALIGDKLEARLEELQEIELFTDVKELREQISSDVQNFKNKTGGKMDE